MNTVLRMSLQSYDVGMAEIAVRELRNDTAEVLRRVEGGEDVTITVRGRPVARLTPVDPRRRALPRAEFVARMSGFQADPGLREQLRELVGEMTDETEIE